MHPIALSIAGSDCSGGAGIQADLKTFQQRGVHGLTAITSIVSETPLTVRHVEPVSMPLLQDQINLLLDSYPISAIKTGLLPTRATTIGVYEILKETQIPLVVDPVMVASTGAQLVDSTTLAVLTSRILPITTLVTPNMAEASAILGRPVEHENDLEPAAKDIAEKHQTSCLVKGGHLPGTGDRLDVLWHQGQAHHYSHPAADLPEGGIHGTGCTLSAAITAGLALNLSIEEAVRGGIDQVQTLIQSAHSWPSGEDTILCLGW
ncbi:bifunctional hydroxymethylpyrimidine kinase/phosphomethylpyrimidine kinase [Verrucomicrobiaceae bacterium N1E253]|uniref:hydroxymethylpyrimidine kinase n=1 Tax=Oceaniferula marina TaxID=2748318 RepID=A0A851GHQ8_9BACT|nr:bifunctional hydroxymethylpyrimidine kinase/phosphomethylpyrimidine kinase [Oceaniferula marina]NWK56412.1 bifunctional hydroxymethylpyrimidine kinase/phosphomethylpyrimidine kinase [Oceaniferula marina]